MILRDPAVESLSSFIGADGTNTTLNSGRLSINLKPLEDRRIRATEVIRRLQKSLAPVQGITLYMQPVQNISVDNRVSRTQYQYTLGDPDAAELNRWTDRLVAKWNQLPQLVDVATDRQNGGLAALLEIDRITASRLGIAPSTLDNTLYDAYGQRQINTLYTQLNQYRVILEALPQFRRDPAMLRKLYIQANTSTGTSGPGAATHVRRVGLGVRGVERAHHSREAHTVVRRSESADQCDSGRHRCEWRAHVERDQQCQLCECGSSRRVHPAGTRRSTALHQSAGPVSCSDDLVQSCAQRFIGKRD